MEKEVSEPQDRPKRKRKAQADGDATPAKARGKPPGSAKKTKLDLGPTQAATEACAN